MEQWEAVKKEKEQWMKMEEEQRRARDDWLEAQEEELRMAKEEKKAKRQEQMLAKMKKNEAELAKKQERNLALSKTSWSENILKQPISQEEIATQELFLSAPDLFLYNPSSGGFYPIGCASCSSVTYHYQPQNRLEERIDW